MHAFLRYVYLVSALASCTYLTTANLRGWSILQPFAVRPAFLPATPLRHK